MEASKLTVRQLLALNKVLDAEGMTMKHVLTMCMLSYFPNSSAELLEKLTGISESTWRSRLEELREMELLLWTSSVARGRRRYSLSNKGARKLQALQRIGRDKGQEWTTLLSQAREKLKGA